MMDLLQDSGSRGVCCGRAEPRDTHLEGRSAMKILYGVVGEGMGHAMRSRVILEHLVAQDHDVEIMASGRAVDFLAKRFEGVNKIHGLHMIYEENRVRPAKTLWSNVVTGAVGVPQNI